MSVEFLAYTDALLPAIAAYWNDNFRQKRNFFKITPELFRLRVIDKRNALEAFDPKGLICAVEDGQVLGMIHVGRRSEEHARLYDPGWKGGDQGYVAFLGVHRYERCKGIGSTLWDKGMEYGAGTGGMVVDGQCLNPFYGNSEGPYTPFWGTPEGISIEWGDATTHAFFRKRGFEPRYRAVQLELDVQRAEVTPISETHKHLEGLGLSGLLTDSVYPVPGSAFPEEGYHVPGNFTTCMALQANTVVGMVTVYPMAELGRSRAAIYESKILDEFQGKGVGSTLLKIAIEKLRADGMAKCDVLTVPDLSPAGLDFYARAGFAPCQEWAIY